MQISAPSVMAPTRATPSTPAATPATAGGAADNSAVTEFMNWMKLSPAEKMREEILQSMGLSEDKLKAMGPKEREKVEEKIKEIVREKVKQDTEKKTGVLIDVKA